MASQAKSGTGNSRVTSVTKAFAILETLGRNGELGITEIARKTRFTKSTVHRLLSTLLNLDYLEQIGNNGKYRLTYKLLTVTANALRSQDFLLVARPFLEQLAEQTGERIHLAILDGTDIVHLHSVDSRHSLTLQTEAGARQPAHATALGKALLAYLSSEELDRRYSSKELQGYTDNTITNVRALKTKLKSVAQTGIATDSQESERGLCCVGAPIFGAEGKPVAAISIAAPCARLKGKDLRNAREQLLRTTREISARLGGLDEPNGSRVSREPGVTGR